MKIQIIPKYGFVYLRIYIDKNDFNSDYEFAKNINMYENYYHKIAIKYGVGFINRELWFKIDTAKIFL